MLKLQMLGKKKGWFSLISRPCPVIRASTNTVQFAEPEFTRTVYEEQPQKLW